MMRFFLGFSLALLLLGGFLLAYPPADSCGRSAVSCVGCAPADKAWLVGLYGR